MQKIVFDSPNVLCKIGLNSHIQALQNGFVYMKNIKYHREQEQKYPYFNTGDELEAMLLKKSNADFILNDTVKIPVELHNVGLDEKYPIFCTMEKNLKMGQRYLPDKRLKQDFALNKIEEYSVLIFDKETFINKCDDILSSKGIFGKSFKVQYTDKMPFCKNLYELAFYKRTRYEYQNEYRLLINYKVDDFFTMNIGSIKDKSFLISAKDFFENGLNFTEKISHAGNPQNNEQSYN